MQNGRGKVNTIKRECDAVHRCGRWVVTASGRRRRRRMCEGGARSGQVDKAQHVASGQARCMAEAAERGVTDDLR